MMQDNYKKYDAGDWQSPDDLAAEPPADFREEQDLTNSIIATVPPK